MAAAGLFHVVFGINETPLTNALENRQFEKALEYIDSRYGMCLDEGCYQRIPLYIVLSGENSAVDGKAMPVHLKVARRLIERGADPNHRVPETCGAEYIGPGSSPLQCVVNHYDLITGREQSCSKEEKIRNNVLSLSGKHINSLEQLVEELINMMWLLLGHGAEVNVRDTENKTPLHSTLLRSCDLRVAQALCDNGASLEVEDCYGNTPLMSLCSPLPWRSSEHGPCVGGDIIDAVCFLLSFKGVKINHCGVVHGRTALFYAMQSGNFEVAKLLLDHGANPSLRGLGPDERYISPLFAAIIPWTTIGRKDSSLVLQKLVPLVDAGYFSTTEILHELLEYANVGNTTEPQLLNLKHFGTNLIAMLFGQSSCSLAQLSSRVFINFKFTNVIFGQFSPSEVVSFVKSQALPTEITTDFLIVLLRHKVLNALMETDWDLWDLEEFMLDESSEYDESDDEYW